MQIQKQQKWEGEGQRYWINEELWGGTIVITYPLCLLIFVVQLHSYA
jgi:hypothetical protein